MNQLRNYLGFAILSLGLTFTSLPVQAAQYQYCFNVKKSRTIRDAANHPTAYNDGYREGIQSAKNGDKYEPRSVGGEFARGFDDGYYGRTVTGQQYTVQDSQESYTGQECRTYYYNEKDSIDQILRNVTRDLERDLKKQWNISD